MEGNFKDLREQHLEKMNNSDLLNTVKEISRKCLLALSLCHQSGIMHSNIIPENFFFNFGMKKKNYYNYFSHYVFS